eukprot:CAMPEP_0181063964 /NCGR_PEP_ID=MMETSP1070-20121207/23938_1 /TAXON_ID=265543 /ORGANISM="Minutocellus polymorphus, Strain NH13" /LENGTH=62 /DNA_ID=CAMNT_0023144227 /DNA_START=64 /DNA_END=252 /DNA_ORIENTATION=+
MVAFLTAANRRIWACASAPDASRVAVDDAGLATERSEHRGREAHFAEGSDSCFCPGQLEEKY